MIQIKWYKVLLSFVTMNLETNSQFGPYEKAMAILRAAMERRYTVLTETFIKEGPEKLKSLMAYENEADWNDLFDYLVSKQGVLKKTVMNYMDFFTNLVADKGPYVLRQIFKIEDSKYDSDFEEIFDLVAISTGALFDYVKKEQMELARTIQRGNAKELRYQLGIKNSKYDGLWFEMLDLLMKAVCDDVCNERDINQGLMAFCTLLNGARAQRSLRSFKKMWEYSEAQKA